MAPGESSAVAGRDSLVAARNLGRAIIALSLEERVLSDGVLPSKPLDERAAIVQGIIDGKLDLGQWQNVVHLVYNPGSNVRFLYTGDKETLDCQIIESAKKDVASWGAGKEISNSANEALSLLVSSGRADAVLSLMEMLPSVRLSFAQEIIQALSRYPLNGAQKARAFTFIAEGALREKGYFAAFDNFMNAGNSARADEVFEKCLADKERRPYSHLDLIKIADRDEKMKSERMAKIIESGLICPAEGIEYLVQECFRYFKRNEGSLPAKTVDILYDAAAKAELGYSGEDWLQPNKPGFDKACFAMG